MSQKLFTGHGDKDGVTKNLDYFWFELFWLEAMESKSYIKLNNNLTPLSTWEYMDKISLSQNTKSQIATQVVLFYFIYIWVSWFWWPS